MFSITIQKSPTTIQFTLHNHSLVTLQLRQNKHLQRTPERNFQFSDRQRNWQFGSNTPAPGSSRRSWQGRHPTFKTWSRDLQVSKKMRILKIVRLFEFLRNSINNTKVWKIILIIIIEFLKWNDNWYFHCKKKK